ncbi:PEP-CTERM sorting domain-containing protein [Duganella sp. FT135W]|uniref:PEP-CTERM sorting domain-containing protein n=1 Tax=Duganella flavida TaxID=2692175 RepID=A0A6L8K9H3_9BURK|nr:FxDxF family PEP-CTERM protein [Duganella flavida]MYM23277.1 PEP-CTERM sorting domain-containing protein [Duganella flavida]
MKKLIAAAVVGLLSTSAFAAVPSLTNASFEDNTVGNGYAYGNVASGWSFTGGGAVSHNYTAWNGVTASGDYFAVLQTAASISQTFTSDVGGVYSINFDMALRSGYNAGQVVSVTLDGNNLGTFPAASTAWGNFSTSSITLGAGAHTLSFQGLTQDHGDTSAFIDNVSLNVSAVPEPATYGMLMAGLGLVGFVARRRKA